MPIDAVIVGGGAAGFFAAVSFAEAGGGRAVILEKSVRVLSKVLISGGGRCNLTHACFEPRRLVEYYPRGAKELLGPFHQFQPRDTMRWFEKRSVALKIEQDGRVFPQTDRSQTIADALLQAARHAGVEIRTGSNIVSIAKNSSGFSVVLNTGETLDCARLLLATGSGPEGYRWAQELGHAIEPPVPSLFTFHIDDQRLKKLAGLSVENAEITLEKTKLKQAGPLLITHWGLSGPAVLKLSAWGARTLHEIGYRARLRVNWAGLERGLVLNELEWFKAENPAKSPSASALFGLPRRLWERLAAAAGIASSWAHVSKEQMRLLNEQITDGIFEIRGKSAFKEEFVNCGGVRLSEVNFKTMESRNAAGLYFAGEILDIDGVTGGFNFQSAWTTGWLAGRAMAGVRS